MYIIYVIPSSQITNASFQFWVMKTVMNNIIHYTLK